MIAFIVKVMKFIKIIVIVMNVFVNEKNLKNQLYNRLMIIYLLHKHGRHSSNQGQTEDS